MTGEEIPAGLAHRDTQGTMPPWKGRTGWFSRAAAKKRGPLWAREERVLRDPSEKAAVANSHVKGCGFPVPPACPPSEGGWSRRQWARGGFSRAATREPGHPGDEAYPTGTGGVLCEPQAPAPASPCPLLLPGEGAGSAPHPQAPGAPSSLAVCFIYLRLETPGLSSPGP